jgi:hypothetical protein
MKRGPKPAERIYPVVVKRRAAWAVELERYHGGKRCRRERRTVRRHETRESANAHRTELRGVDLRAEWERLCATERTPERPVRTKPAPEPLPIAAGLPERTADGRWTLACGMHESRRVMLRCHVCERAHAANAARLDEVAAGSVRRWKWTA